MKKRRAVQRLGIVWNQASNNPHDLEAALALDDHARRTLHRPVRPNAAPKVFVPLTFYPFGQHGGHFVAETSWKEMMVPLIVDTGSTHSLLHAGLFIHKDGAYPTIGGGAKADQSTLMVVGGGGTTSCSDEPVQVSGMLLGPVELPPGFWNLLDLKAIRNRYRENGYPPPCGLIGLDMLRQLRAIVDCSLDNPSLGFPQIRPHQPKPTIK